MAIKQRIIRPNIFDFGISITFCCFHFVGKTHSFKYVVNVGANLFGVTLTATNIALFEITSKPGALFSIIFFCDYVRNFFGIFLNSG